MKRVLLVIVAALAVFAGILVALPSFIDWNKYRSQIVAQMGEATGHYYDIGGGLSLAILPFPHVAVEKLSIAPAKGEEPLASIERADVSVALMPLFKGKVDVSSVSLVKPDIRLSIAADGTPSWMTPVLKEKMAKKDVAAGDSSQVAESVALNNIRIKDGAFKFTDKRSGKTYELKDIDVALHADTLRGPFNAEGSFEYNGQAVKADVKTGKIAAGADSIALQIAAKAGEASLNWSGVVAFKDGIEIQGETALDAGSAGALAALAGGKAAAGYEKPLSLRGILTASASRVAFQNMKLSYAGMSGTGSFSVDNISGGQIPVIAADLSMDGPVDLVDLMPPAAPAKEKRFMPESITLPQELGAKIAFSAPAVSYAGKSFTDVRSSITYSGKTLSYDASAAMPGRGSGTGSGTLSFGGMSKSAQTEAVTLSDPVLSYNFSFQADRVEEALKGFVAAPQLNGKVSAKGKGKLTPKRVSVDESVVNAGGIAATVGAAYTPGQRDMVKLSVSAAPVDLDKFIPPADPKAKGSLQDTLAKFSLPFDLDATWALEQAKFRGRDYDRLAGHAVMTGKALKISALEVKDAKGNAMTAAGGIGDIAALKDIDISIQGSTPDAPALIAEATGKPASLPEGVKAGDIVAAFKGQPEKLDFTANLKAMNGTLDVSGVLADALSAPAVGALTVRLKHPNYVDLARLFMPDFKSGVAIKKSLDVFASLKRDGAVYTVSELQADVGPAQLTGAVTADLSGAKPSIAAKIQAGDLPLDELLGHDVRHKGAVQSQPLRGQGQESRWSRAPMNNEWMHKFNFKVEGTAKSFSYGPWELANAGFDIRLQDGVLTVSQVDGSMYGGQVAMSGKAVSTAPSSPLTVDGKTTLQNVSLADFVESFSGSKLVKARGTVSVDAAVETEGNSPMTLISALGGKGSVEGNNLVFEGFDLARLSRSLAQPPGGLKEGLSSILDASMSGGSTKFDTLSSAFTINKGEVDINELELAGPDATVSSPGRVNLPLWTIDMESTIQVSEPKDAPALKVVFKGPLDNPGQTFAKGAMDNYVRSLIGAKVQDALINKLQDKKALEGEGGQLLQGIIGGLTGQPVKQPQQQSQQPQQAPAPEAVPVQEQQAAPQQVQPAPQPQEQQKKITPEDVFQGVLQGVLQGR